MKNIAYAGTLAALLDIDMDIVVGDAQGEVRAKARADGVEHEGHPPRLRLRQEDTSRARSPSGSTKMDATTDNILIDGNTATALGARLRRGDGRRVVPDHAVHQRARRLQVALRGVPHRQGDRQAALLHPASGGRARRGRHGHRRGLERRARVHVDRRARHLADERARRASRTTPRSRSSSSTCSASAPRPGCPRARSRGTSCSAPTRRTATRSTSCSSRRTRRSASSFAVKAFDLAERFQTPVFMLTDLDIGMNDWVVPRLEWDDAYRPDRGRVLTREELEAMPKYYRYSPEDELGVAARTLPGVHEKGAFFTRGLGPQQARRLHRDPGRVPGGDGSPLAQAPRRAQPRPGGHHRAAPQGDVRRRHAGRLRPRGPRGARRPGAAGGRG